MKRASPKAAITYLRAREWSMGHLHPHGQCPECYGVSQSWFGHPCHLTPDTIGHVAGCPLAEALVALGEKPLMVGEFRSPVRYETYSNEHGILCTRIVGKS